MFDIRLHIERQTSLLSRSMAKGLNMGLPWKKSGGWSEQFLNPGHQESESDTLTTSAVPASSSALIIYYLDLFHGSSAFKTLIKVLFLHLT